MVKIKNSVSVQKGGGGYDVGIVGGGPAGLTAGIYAGRAGLDVIILDKGGHGGLLTEAPLVENYPAFKSVEGPQLAEKMKEHAADYAEIRGFEEVERIERVGERFMLITKKGNYSVNAVILATGTAKRKLGVPGEDEYRGKGVSYCAMCDGFFFRGKKVLVVGGGAGALCEAIYLQKLGCKVTLVHRMDRLRAESALEEEFVGGGGRILWNTIVKEIKGGQSVKSVVIENLKDGRLSDLYVNGVFIAVGEIPNNKLAKMLGVRLDGRGYVVTGNGQRTNVSMVYAAGDITGGLRQVVTSCGKGAIAAVSAFCDIAQPYWVKKQKP